MARFAPSQLLWIEFQFEKKPMWVGSAEDAAGVLIDYGVVGPIYPAWLPGAKRMLRYYDSGEYDSGNAIFMMHGDDLGKPIALLSADGVAAINYELQRTGHWKEPQR